LAVKSRRRIIGTRIYFITKPLKYDLSVLYSKLSVSFFIFSLFDAFSVEPQECDKEIKVKKQTGH
jgi:hypothetical protein